ncbi:hypothetical protein QJQ45_001288 [Haematococcus lacustris]|nr:hypothetical protein QJQ45_001288 [Haematococcus lacustris]
MPPKKRKSTAKHKTRPTKRPRKQGQVLVRLEASNERIGGTDGRRSVAYDQRCRYGAYPASRPSQAPCNSQVTTQPATSEPGPSTAMPAKCSKRTKAEQASEPTQLTKGKGKAKGKAAEAKPTPQPSRWVDRDCNAAPNMQRFGEAKWRPLELCWWPEQGKLPAKGKEYPGLGCKRLRGWPLKAQKQQQPAVAHQCM